MEINSRRLARIFVELCETESPSRHEARVAEYLKSTFADLGADEIIEDDSAAVTGADCGNLIFRFHGRSRREPIFFNAHMDTVEPVAGIRVLRRGDTFHSQGDTILGSDDKSAIAALIEAMHCVREKNRTIRPLEFIFTTCEEIGLLGAKALDPDLINARMGYALDSCGINRVIIGAPAANRITVTITGAAAHAGLNPEEGINAIMLAARALARLPNGRIDRETTVNFGTIKGGIASNIVAERVKIVGEVRSHSPEKLARNTARIREEFLATINAARRELSAESDLPRVRIDIEEEFPHLRLSRQDRVVREISEAAALTGLDLSFAVAGGGSDANIFNGYDLQTAIVATGMEKVHSTAEHIRLEDMVTLTRLILALMTGSTQ